MTCFSFAVLLIGAMRLMQDEHTSAVWLSREKPAIAVGAAVKLSRLGPVGCGDRPANDQITPLLQYW